VLRIGNGMDEQGNAIVLPVPESDTGYAEQDIA
jgi:hypothetical protein